MPFQIHTLQFFGEVISRHSIQPDWHNLKGLIDMPPKTKKEIQAFLKIITYLGKASPSTTDTISTKQSGLGMQCMRRCLTRQNHLFIKDHFTCNRTFDWTCLVLQRQLAIGLCIK